MTSNSNKTEIKKTALLSYGALALPLAFAGLPFYIHAPDFYIRFHGISLAVMGSVLLGVRLVDAIQDPLIGHFSDIFARKRVLIIMIALCLLGTGFALLYNPTSWMSPVIWFCVSMIIAAFAFSTITINLNALGSLWSKNSIDKTRIAAWREGLGLIGLLLATLLPTILELKLSIPDAFHIYAVLFLILIVITGATFYRWGRRHQNISDDAIKTDKFIYRRLAILFKPPFGWFFTAYGLSMTASSIPGVLVLLFIRDRLNAEKMTGPFLIIYFLAGIIGMPLWNKLSIRLGKQKTWMMAMILALSSFIWAYTLESGDIIAYGIICFLSGLALGAELILPSSIVSDLIDGNKLEGDTSSVFAILHFLGKLALAIASGFSFLLLDFFGFVPGQNHDNESLKKISIVYALLPCIIKALAASIVWLKLKNRNQNVFL